MTATPNTTLTADRRSVPLPRWGLPWVTWRQHRTALLGTAAVLAGLAAYFLVTGLVVRSDYRALGLPRCASFTSGSCERLAQAFRDGHQNLFLVEYLLILLPGLIGMFVGGPLVAREYESGTFRFAWTQGAGRTRWIVTKLTLLGLALTAATQALDLLYGWWRAPFTGLSGSGLNGVVFELSGLLPAARTLFVFALGACCGALVRRTVPAMAAAFATGLGASLGLEMYVWPRLLTPRTARITGPGAGSDASLPDRTGPGFTYQHWWTDPHGHRLTTHQLDVLVARLAAQHQEANAWLGSHGYTYWFTYQPASRYWAVQGLEAGGLALLALALCAVTVALVRRRAT